MKKICFCVTALILCCCIGIVLTGCAKKATTKQDPGISEQQAQAAAAERERGSV